MLEIKDLTKYFPITRGIFSKSKENVHAVDKVNLTINKGETLGLVGESGCGKSTLARCILRLLEPDSGEITFENKNLLQLSRNKMRELRKELQIIFQDPYASLNPRMTIGNIIGEGLIIHRLAKGKEKKERVIELLKKVVLRPEYINRYPHEFSGGQRQRIGIARALAVQPKLIIADEPVSALDVSIQAQIINLLMDLQSEFGLTYLLIAHDLRVVKYLSNNIAVMHLGKIVEFSPSHSFYSSPLHPYSQALISAVPIPYPGAKKNRIILEGDLPSPIDPPIGCHFRTRCWMAKEICRLIEPPLEEKKKGCWAACHFAGPKT